MRLARQHPPPSRILDVDVQKLARRSRRSSRCWAVGPRPRRRPATTPPWTPAAPRRCAPTLHEVIDDHTRFPYTSSGTDTWNILEAADQDPANSANILDVYRNRSYVKFGGGTGPYNREHTWPNSYGFPDDGGTNYPYTDCHQLFLSDVGYNSDRANKPFGNLRRRRDRAGHRRQRRRGRSPATRTGSTPPTGRPGTAARATWRAPCSTWTSATRAARTASPTRRSRT